MHPTGRRGRGTWAARLPLVVVVTLVAGCAGAAPGTPTGVPLRPGATGQEPAGVLPLPATRPVLNPVVNDVNLATTVCAGTKRFRPPRAYTDEVKRIEVSTPVGSHGSIRDPRDGQVYQVPGYAGFGGLGPSDSDRVELDHFLPLSNGGDGYNPANLWPEIGGTTDAPLVGADGQPANSEVKDDLEYYAYRQLCPTDRGPATMTLAQVRALYEPDWYATYVRLGRPHIAGSGTAHGTSGAAET